jgi:hypothetical protein
MPASTTKIEAVNTILSAVGSSPINSLTGAQSGDVRIAISTLDEISREVQAVGWHFNTDEKVPLTPDPTTLEITLAESIVRCDLEEEFATNLDIVQRGRRLYDKTNRTYQFTNPLQATTVTLLEWDDLPEQARRYILIRAARIFNDRMVGSVEHHQFTALDEMQARAALVEFEGDTADYSIFDNWAVGRIVYRGI